MITPFHTPKTRSTRFIFLLEELGAPYVLRLVTLRQRDGSGAVDPANPHPHGEVPAIRDQDGTLVFKSAAIALYLTDKFPKAGLGPMIGDPMRGAYLSWLAYYAGVMEPAWMSGFMKWEIPRGTAGWVKNEEVMEFVNDTLAKNRYLLGEKFSAVDILVGTSFAMFLGGPLLPKTDLLEAYVARVTERPAFARAQGLQNG